MLGECSHGTHEFYAARAAITRRLVERHGFTIVAVEARFIELDAQDVPAVDAHPFPAAKETAALGVELDDPVADRKQRAVHATAIAQKQRVGLQGGREEETAESGGQNVARVHSVTLHVDRSPRPVQLFYRQEDS